MPETRSFTAPQGRPRLDAFLGAQAPDVSRSYAKKLIADGMVTVNGTEAKPAYALRGGDLVSVVIPDPQRLDLTPEPIPLAVVYEDADLIVVDKSAGMTVHPAPGHPRGTLVHALLAHCPDLAGIGGVERPGIVHRLDKDTSGLIAAAKNAAAHRSLTGQFKARTVSKMYLALVKGRPRQSEGRIDATAGPRPPASQAHRPRRRRARGRHRLPHRRRVRGRDAPRSPPPNGPHASDTGALRLDRPSPSRRRPLRRQVGAPGAALPPRVEPRNRPSADGPAARAGIAVAPRPHGGARRPDAVDT